MKPFFTIRFAKTEKLDNILLLSEGGNQVLTCMLARCKFDLRPKAIWKNLSNV